MPIFEEKSITNVSNYLQPGALLVLDLDNTLIESAFHYGSYQWGNFLIREALKEGANIDQALDQVMPLWDKAQHEIEIRTIEEEIEKWLNLQHAQKTLMLGLTGRSHKIATVTLNHLKKHGLSFSNWGFCEPFFKESTHFHLEEGVIFVGPKNNKGEALLHFIHHVTTPIKQIVFVDDQISYLKQVEKSLEGLEVEYIGIRYGGADNAVDRFDLAQAKKEQLKFSKD
ncbi:MAG: hypothetical protein S4CHLAM6_01190 [Chlamydiae bacterium]|nr:hypothetical protein [Chlamydiota bacterium]